MARRYRSLHFGNMEGKNVPFHREHRSKRGRRPNKVWGMKPYQHNSRNKWKKNAEHLMVYEKKVREDLL